MNGQEAVERASQLDVCAVSDALDGLGLTGAVAGIRPLWSGPRVVARVVTMKVVPAHGARAPRHLGAAAIEAAEAGMAIVIEQDSEPDAACWGGLLARAASTRGVAGVVIDGMARDVDEIQEIGLPLFGRGVVPFTARRRVVEASVNEPVSIGGVTVSPGDLVVADGSGLAFVAAQQFDDVTGAAQRIVERERQMIRALESGKPPSEVLGMRYEELLDGH